MYSVFVNYRRGAHSVSVKALAERLAQHFGDDEVFIDNGMPSGERYPQKIKERLHGCEVLVSVIHNDWVSTFGAPRKRDWVQYEIATAFRRRITVIPVLLEDAKAPAWDQLPPDIADITLLQYAHLRSGEFRSDVDQLVRRIEHHVDLYDDPPPDTTVKAGPKRTGWRIAALAVLLSFLTAIVFYEAGPLWRMFAFPAFGSAVILALASSATVILTWSLRRLGARWEQRAGIRTHREALSRTWIQPALLIVLCAYFVSRAMAEGGWQEWERWILIVTVLLAAAYLHRWWRLITAGDNAWPPPVTTDHWVFRRAALRLHDKLTTEKAWRYPRSRTAQRQAVSLYLDLAQVRKDLTARATLSITAWIRGGYNGQTTFYLSWFTSIVLLDLLSVAALVFGEPGPGFPLRLFVVTVAGAALFTTAMVTTYFLFDRYRVRSWIDELTAWQRNLGPLIFCADERALEKARQ